MHQLDQPCPAAPAASGRFPTTQWSEVGRAAGAAAADPAVRRAALGRLLRQYLPAFRAHLLARKGVPLGVVDDLVQGFACDQLVADDLIARADRERGRLRTFLLTALDRYVAGVRRRDSARKRHPGTPPVSLGANADSGSDEVALTAAEPEDPAAGASVAQAFDVAWARQVVAQAVERMREQCRAGGQDRTWELFHCRVLGPLLERADPPPYEQLVGRFGFASPLQASNALVTAKRTFSRVLRAVIVEYAADNAEVDAEIADLWASLAAAGRAAGRPGGRPAL